jgi:hypothetical protein
MRFLSFEKNEGKTMVYAVEIDRAEIERTPFDENDQAFFKSCAAGSVSKKVLGISILAKKIETHREEPEDLKTRYNFKIIEDPSELEPKLEHTELGEAFPDQDT